MSRPIRLFLPVACAVLSLGLSACVGTLYDRMYSNKKNYFKAPVAKSEASAEDILGAVDATKPAASPDGLPTADPGAVLPPPGDIPGLPPAMPADPAAPPATPPAPAMAPPPL